MTSEELTPEMLRRWVASMRAGSHDPQAARRLDAAADLIESQQARIAELEAALADLCMHQKDAWRLDGLLDDYRSMLPAYRPASPDTPEETP